MNQLSRDNRLLGLSVLLWGIGDGLYIYIQPLYLAELGADPVAIGSILALAGAVMMVSHIPAGYLADHFGRKQVLVAGWLIATLAALLMYLAPSLPFFVAGMLVAYFTGFVLSPISSYATEARGAQSVQRAVTLVSAAYWTGSILSPTIGGWIGQVFGLRQVYGVSVIAFVLSTAVVLLLKPQPLAPPTAGHTRYGALLRNGRLLGYLALTLAALSAMEIGIPLAPNFVVEARHLDVSRVGLLGSVNSLGVVCLNVAFGQRAPRRGFMLGQVMIVIYLALLLFAPGSGWLVLAFLFRAGWNLTLNMAIAQVGRVVEPSQLGLAYGMVETVLGLALVIGPRLAGELYERDPALPFQVSLVLVAVTLPLAWRFAPRRDAHSETEVLPLPERREA